MTQVVPRGPATRHFDPTCPAGTCPNRDDESVALPLKGRRGVQRAGLGDAHFLRNGLIIGDTFGKCALVVLVELQLIKPPVETTLREQILMGARLADLAFVHHDDLVH